MTNIRPEAVQTYLDSQKPLKALRRTYIERLLAIPADALPQVFNESLIAPYRQLLDADIRWLALDVEDRDLGRELQTQWQHGFAHAQGVQVFMALSLLYPPHRWECPFDGLGCPGWFLETYLDVLLAMPRMFTRPGELDEYYRYLLALLKIIDQHYLLGHARVRWIKIGSYCAQKINMMPVLFTSHNLKAIQQMRARIIEKTFQLCGKPLDYHFSGRRASARIRLGFLCNHLMPGTETFGSIPLFEALDSNRFEVTLYVKNLARNSIEDYCRSRVHALVPLPQDLDQSVRRIRQDDIDILLIGNNLSAVFTDMVYLGVHRLARIQIPYPGSITTTGFSHCDLFISTKLCERQDNAQELYSETLVFHQGTSTIYARQAEESHAPERELTHESFGIANKSVRFISGANCMKIIPELFQTWVDILKQVPGATLILYPFGPAWYPDYPQMLFAARLYEVLCQQQLDPRQLVLLGPVSTRAEIFEYLKLGDVYLDSFPFSGGTSIHDPLLAGLPVVTRQGGTVRHNMAASTLRDMGLDDLVAKTDDEYRKIALKLALDLSYRQEQQDAVTRATEQGPVFFDKTAFNQTFSECLVSIAQSHLSQLCKLLDLEVSTRPGRCPARPGTHLR